MPARLLSSSVRRRGLFAALAVAALALLPVCSASAAHRRAALTPFERAEQMRDALEAKRESSRTRGEYERLLDAYRTVYHGDPADPKAQQSIEAVAVLLAEEGRIFQHEKASLDAIGQYEFLRTQYPGSPFRAPALLNEGTIYLHDLHDPTAAKAVFLRFLNDYPTSPLAEQARAGLKEIRHEPAHSKRAEVHPETAQESAPLTDRQNQPVRSNHPSAAEALRESSEPNATATTNAAHANELTHLQAAASPVSTSANVVPPTAANSAAGQPVLTGPTRVAAQEHHGRLPLVTNVRHWSTPVYTRVAIDLQEQVQYEAARVPNPDRIYFDLHGAKVAPELIGKSVDVTDDGYLQRIRVAQFSNDVTRIVLDVSQVSEYSAFFLPNPWRLIIDIHGRRPEGPQQQIAAAPASRTPASNVRLPEPVAASSQGSTQAATALRDIAAVGAQPDQVRATRKPTTRPIAASVPANSTSPATNAARDEETDAASADDTPPPATVPPARAGKGKTARRKPQDDTSAGQDESSGLTSSGLAAGDSVREATSTVDGQRSLTRALGLKIGRIVVDAGHGGHDSGTLGPGGIQEKDVVLDVALRLGKLLRQRLGAEVTYTRDDNTFVPLEQRTAIANKAQADLFISVHANSSADPTARGVETYYLNFTTSPDALEVAARENAVSDESVHELSGLVKKITLKDKIDESREFAADVEGSLYGGLERGNPGLKDRGVKKAPFVVLIGANMPSILAEISFLTNPDDATQLREPQYRERIAESLYRGVAKYVSGLSGLRVAQNSSRIAGN